MNTFLMCDETIGGATDSRPTMSCMGIQFSSRVRAGISVMNRCGNARSSRAGTRWMRLHRAGSIPALLCNFRQGHESVMKTSISGSLDASGTVLRRLLQSRVNCRCRADKALAVGSYGQQQVNLHN